MGYYTKTARDIRAVLHDSVRTAASGAFLITLRSAQRPLGRFRCDAGKTQSHCVGPGLLPLLRSKLPR
jgi:hypothetical protein